MPQKPLARDGRMNSKWFISAMILILLLVVILFVVYWMRIMAQTQTHETFSDKEKDFGFTLPIYVISLPIRKESRLDPLLKRIKPDSHDPPCYEIVEVNAVDGRSDVVDDRETFMSPGQAGCFLSHVYFWKKIATGSEPFALVLEDDAMIHLPEMIPELVDLVSSLPTNWDVLYLGGVYQNHREGHTHEIKRLKGKIVSSDAFMFYSHAYFITRDAAAEMLEKSETIAWGGKDGGENSSLRAFDAVIPVDEWMTHEDRNMQVYNTDPVLITKSDDGVSDTYDMPPETRTPN